MASTVFPAIAETECAGATKLPAREIIINACWKIIMQIFYSTAKRERNLTLLHENQTAVLAV